MKPFDFRLINVQTLSKICLEKGFLTFLDLCDHVKNLPYGRTTDRGDYASILNEGKGTCSTKHAFLAQVAIENSVKEIALYIGIYQMDEKNTKGIGSVLDQFNLDYIPEAHTYLKIDGTTFDFTSKNSFQLNFKDRLMKEEKILPYQIGDYKTDWHQAFIKDWIMRDAIPLSFETIWDIRETCIANLSQ